jgi:DNA-binding GntR family transcriptional regulator
MSKLSTKSDIIAETLAEEIIRGEFQPGARLGQNHIAEHFNCSHVPVREALQRLVQVELATSEPRRGVRVVELSDNDYAEIKEMRLALEPLALRHAVTRFHPKDMAYAQECRLACDQAQDPIVWEKANREFHLAILAPCNLPRLLRHIEVLQRLSAQHFHAIWRQNWVSRPDRDHAAILNAIAEGDADTASRVLLRHLSRG